ncbi:anaerobic ribonucleoside-triphosphate reductase activating protein [Candidatus Microgenomates bacterium]|nr:anaerobic ribonucleoside-triphosphate reductase activating protein [Candidatus Microgenomates bacterium]
MNIRGYLQTSVNEWPGKIAAVVWVANCNLRCSFCQNRDLIFNPAKLSEISEKEIFRDLKERKKWVDALIITGGEPTLQPDLASFLKKIKKIGFLIMIETNGTRPDIMAKLLDGQMVDRISMDIKGPLDESYAKIAGKRDFDFTIILDSIAVILKSGIDFELRTTVVPTLHTKQSLVELAKQLKKIIKHTSGAIRHTPIWYLQQFVPQNCLDSSFEKIKPFSKKKMEENLLAVQKYFPAVRLRGI